MQPGSEKSSLPIKPRRRFLRPLLATLVITSLLTAFAFMLLPRVGKSSGFDQGELKLGSTTFRFDFDDDEPDGFFQHESWDGRDGELSSGRRITIGLPLGTLELGYTHEPLDAIRRRLPNTVEALTELLNSRDHFEVFAAAEALTENPTGAVIALPKLLAVAENSVYIAGAIEPIALIAPKESVPALISGLCSTNMQLRDYCGSILARLGSNALAAAPAVRSAFHSKRIHVTTAALALQKITGDCSLTVPALRDELKNGPPDQRVHILRALGEAGNHAAPA